MSSPDPMAEIRASFFIECEELLEALQDGLTALDSGDQDPETINVCFRAVHSIKGGAGAFGLEQLVRFSHRYETVMDEMRSGTLVADRDAMMLFFRAADVLSDIVRAARDGEELSSEATESILKELEALTSTDGAKDAEEDGEEVDPSDFMPMTLSLDLPDLADEDTGPPTYVISFAPLAQLFASGNEPLHIIRALEKLGTISVEPDIASIPDLEAAAPDSAWIKWTITLQTEQPKSEIEETFDFVDGLCDLTIEEKASEAVGSVAEIEPLEPEPAQAFDAAPTVPALEEVPEEPTEEQADVAEEAEGEADQDPPAKDASGNKAPSPTPPLPTRERERKEPAPTATKATVRVDLDRIDRLVNLVGELVINQAMLSQSVAEAGLATNSQVAQGLEEFMQLTRDIQDSVMMIRAQPVKSLFQRMSRIVREASATVGKRVRLVTEGEATEVDKTVIERLADPLTHMIRNAVDHGLEDPARRRESGKSEEGTVTLTAAHRSGRVIIEIKDDGGGINREKVKSLAEKKGLIPEGIALSDGEIDALLFLPGFSTANEVSDLSGRGVGMDVVRSSIQDLGGRITISSEPGVGTTFQISLPLTLAVLDGMVVKVAGETLVVPLGSILETITLQDSDVRILGPETHVLQIRETFVPLLDLGTELGYRAPSRSYDGSVVLLITKEDGDRAALIVDRIQEQRQVVIKGLQDSYGRVPGIAAATILGDGQIALILDPVDLMAKSRGRAKPALKHEAQSI